MVNVNLTQAPTIQLFRMKVKKNDCKIGLDKKREPFFNVKTKREERKIQHKIAALTLISFCCLRARTHEKKTV